MKRGLQIGTMICLLMVWGRICQASRQSPLRSPEPVRPLQIPQNRAI